MKQILALALFVAIIGFINAQSPSVLTPLACKTYNANATGAGFCSSTNYQVLESADLAALNTAAQATATGILNQITNASAACISAVNALACQNSISKCGRYSPITAISQTRCDAISTACNITGFPNNYTTIRCVRNNLVSIDGSVLVCVPTAFTTVGNACGGAGIFDPASPTPVAPIQSLACPLTASCNITANANVCVRPSGLGQSCFQSTDCASIAGTAAGTPALECLGGKCSFRGKRHAQACLVNEECRSNQCFNGTCFESIVGGACNTTLQCRDNLWCDATNKTCNNAAQNGEQCGIVQANWSPVPCVPGYTCVRNNGTDFSYCRGNAEVGAACRPFNGAVSYEAPLCDPATIPTTGAAQCLNNVCTLVTGQAQGVQCNSTIFCQPQLTCQYVNGSSQGTCVPAAQVACDTVGGNQCSASQMCQCGGNVEQTGTCAVSTMNPAVACAQAQIAVAQCLRDKCRTAGSVYVPYDGSSCGAQQCTTQVNAYFCCIKTAVGANFIAPPNGPADPCVTVAPSTTPSPSGTPGSNTPTPTPSRSGASSVAVSFVAIIAAIVAFCL